MQVAVFGWGPQVSMCEMRLPFDAYSTTCGKGMFSIATIACLLCAGVLMLVQEAAAAASVSVWSAARSKITSSSACASR